MTLLAPRSVLLIGLRSSRSWELPGPKEAVAARTSDVCLMEFFSATATKFLKEAVAARTSEVCLMEFFSATATKFLKEAVAARTSEVCLMEFFSATATKFLKEAVADPTQVQSTIYGMC